MEQERRQDVSQMSMMPIPQGNIYQPQFCPLGLVFQMFRRGNFLFTRC
jgi:hypothetical protein